MTTTNSFLFRNANLLDPLSKDLLEGHDILVEGGVVREVSDCDAWPVGQASGRDPAVAAS